MFYLKNNRYLCTKEQFYDYRSKGSYTGKYQSVAQ